MTTLVDEHWTGGANGAACSKTNTVYNRLITHFTFDTSAPPTGETASGHMAATAQTAQAQVDVPLSDVAYEEIWIKAASQPPADLVIASLRNTVTATNVTEILILTTGAVRLRDAGYVSVVTSPAGSIHTGQWNKIQRFYDRAAGQGRLRVFHTDPYGNTPDYDSGLVAMTTPRQYNMAQIGAINAITWAVNFGRHNINTDGFIVPGGGGGGGGGTIGYRGSATPVAVYDGNHDTSIVVPSDVVATDLMLLSFVGGQNTIQTDPAGWTRLPIHQGVADMLSFDCWWRKATGTDHGTTVTTTSSNTHFEHRHLHLDVFSGDAVVGDCSSRMASVASASHPTPEVITQSAHAWVLSGAADRDGPPSRVWTAPGTVHNLSTNAEATTDGAEVGSVTGNQQEVGVGSVGSVTITGTRSLLAAVAWSVAIEPVGTTSVITVNAGPDLYVEPWADFTITPVASGGVPDSWEWQELSVSTEQSITPGLPHSILDNSTVDTDGTIHLSAPGWLGLVHVTLRAIAHKAGSTDAGDNIVISIYPATQGWVNPVGEIKALRFQQVT